MQQDDTGCGSNLVSIKLHALVVSLPSIPVAVAAIGKKSPADEQRAGGQGST
jgi:hypothetical protein